MSSKLTHAQKRKIAQQNGAKSAGTKSPEGLQASALNALSHGLASKTLVLENESPEQFGRLLHTYVEKFQPQDGVEMNLVEEMVAARWRQQRIWGIQTTALNLEMNRQNDEVDLPEDVTERSRLALAFSALSKSDNSLALLMRYETSYSRMHDRAMKNLAQLRENPILRNEPKPADPTPAEPVKLPAPEPKSKQPQPQPAGPRPVQANRGPVLVPTNPTGKPVLET